jgi:hypothetical protein
MDRWVAPREQVLNIPIVCQRYGPGNPSGQPPTEGGFTPTASMAVLGEKLGMDPWIGQSFFSRVVALSIAIDDFTKGCYALTA